jgi:hypothetical protein
MVNADDYKGKKFAKRYQHRDDRMRACMRCVHIGDILKTPPLRTENLGPL